jgi:large conductance mechanosensitive channel
MALPLSRPTKVLRVAPRLTPFVRVPMVRRQHDWTAGVAFATRHTAVEPTAQLIKQAKEYLHMGFMTEFKEFAVKGNVMDLAVGVIIGGAFGKIVDSLVGDIIMPIVGKIFGGLNFDAYFIPLSGQTATTLIEAKKAGAVLAYGSFITVAINFIILAFIIFLMVKQMNRLKREAPPAPPAAPPEDVVLLREIRDALKK